MTNDDEERFAALMLEMAEAVSQEASPFKIEIYFKHLSDMPYEEIERAFQTIIRTRVTATFPKVAEIRQAVHGNPEDRAQVAWNQLINAIRCIGGYQSVMFDDPVIHAIVDREGGWEQISGKTIDELKWFSKDFMKIYAAFLPRINDMSVTTKLKGLHEASYELHNKQYPHDVVIIGDPQKALEWTGRIALKRNVFEKITRGQ